MKAADLRNKSKEELFDSLFGLSKEQFNLRMLKGSGQLAKSDQVRKVRKQVARIYTILGEKERAGK